MNRTSSSHLSRGLEWFAVSATRWTGSSVAFLLALLLTLAWLGSGWWFGFSDTWQLVMNTLSSIVTFLMVFLIQRSQNKDSSAIQLKLDELIASQRGASNRLIGIENLTEDDVRALHERYERMAQVVLSNGNITGPVSIEKAAKLIHKHEERTKAEGGPS